MPEILGITSIPLMGLDEIQWVKKSKNPDAANIGVFASTHSIKQEEKHFVWKILSN